MAGFDSPTLVAPQDRFGLGKRVAETFRVPEETTRAVGELARSQHTTVSTVLQGAWALLLTSLTGQHDIAFGAVVSGRPDEVVGAESMVGLLINTVPVRATITSTTTVAGLLEQLQTRHNDTLEHQHLALSDIHRIAGHDQLFDTVFVYENYPTDSAAFSGVDGLAITDVTNRDFYHYPLTIQAVPGTELVLSVQYRSDLFDAATIDALMERFSGLLVAMTAEPTRRLSTSGLLDGGTHARPDGLDSREVSQQAMALSASGYRAPDTLVEQILAGIYAEVLGVERVGVDDSFFDLGGDSHAAMRVIAAINTALDSHITVRTLFEAPSVSGLSGQLSGM